MKKLFLTLVILQFCISCDHDAEVSTVDLSKLATTLGGTYESKPLTVVATEQLQLVLLQRSSPSTANYEMAYVLQLENADVDPISMNDELVVFHSAVLAKSKTGFLFVAVESESNVELLNSIKNMVGTENVTAHFGFGLSKIKGAWPVEQEFSRGNAYDNLATSRGTSNGKTSVEDVGGSTKCTSGGPGSSECSIGSTIGPLGTSCQVSCKTGYYACCKSSNTTCFCIKEAAD